MKLKNFTPDEAGRLYMLLAEAMADPNRQEQEKEQNRLILYQNYDKI